MVVNFRTFKINRDAYKLMQTHMLKKISQESRAANSFDGRIPWIGQIQEYEVTNTTFSL
jgi:hypothetical protein